MCRDPQYIAEEVASFTQYMCRLIASRKKTKPVEDSVFHFGFTPNRPQNILYYTEKSQVLLDHGFTLDAKPPNVHGVIEHHWSATRAVADAFATKFGVYEWSQRESMYIRC